MDLGTSASAVLKSEVDTVTFLSGSTATGPMSTQLVKNKSTKREEEQYLYRMRQMHRRKAFSALLKWARGAARMRYIELFSLSNIYYDMITALSLQNGAVEAKSRH